MTTDTIKKRYGLFTAIAMIIGIVIGSGLFFKSDNILIATGGNVVLGVIIFCFAAVSIIFGSLTVAELASRTDEPGGVLTYARVFINPMAGSAYGWFQTFVYLPTITVVLSWVSGIYFCIFFNINASLELQCLVGFGLLTGLYLMNMLSARLAGLFHCGSGTAPREYRNHHSRHAGPSHRDASRFLDYGDPLGGLLL